MQNRLFSTTTLKQKRHILVLAIAISASDSSFTSEERDFVYALSVKFCVSLFDTEKLINYVIKKRKEGKLGQLIRYTVETLQSLSKSDRERLIKEVKFVIHADNVISKPERQIFKFIVQQLEPPKLSKERISIEMDHSGYCNTPKAKKKHKQEIDDWNQCDSRALYL